MKNKLTPFKLMKPALNAALKNTKPEDHVIMLTDFCMWMKTEYDEKNFEMSEDLVSRYLKTIENNKP